MLGLDTTNAPGGFTYGNPITGNMGLAMLGPNPLTLSGTNTYAGSTIVNAGVLTVTSSSALPSYASTGATMLAVNSGATVMLDVSGSGWSAAGVNGLLSGANTAGFAPGSTLGMDTSAGNFVCASPIGGYMGLTKAGSSTTLTLSATNTYSGPTTVTGGTLDLASGGALQGSTLVTSTAGSVLFDSSVSPAAFTFGGLSGLGNLSLQNSASAAVALTVGGNGANTTYAGTLAGLGSLIKTGDGTLTLNGNSSYSGTTTVSGGVLAVAATNNLPGFATNGRVAVNNGGTLALRVGGSGWQATDVTNLLLANSGNFTGVSGLGLDTTNGNFTFGPLAGSMGLTKLGANALSLTGASTFSGPITISGGTLQLGDGSGHDGTLSGTAGITDNAAFVYNNLSTSQTYGGSISGYGSLTKLGGNLLVLTASNSYSGSTAISGGTLQLGTGASGNDGSLSAVSGIADNSWLVYNLAGADLREHHQRLGQFDEGW